LDEELWRWIWLGAAVVFGLGEIVTAGFFLLPFAAGAAVAALLAFLDVDPVVQGVVFLVFSVLALIALRRFADRSTGEQHPVGANRFVGEAAVATGRIDRVGNQGRVRMGTEVWRATTDGPAIETGAEVRVVGVRGTRLVVQPLDQAAQESAAEQEDR
jgi:membrane protein implicated in regulation of membrane protease activity